MDVASDANMYNLQTATAFVYPIQHLGPCLNSWRVLTKIEQEVCCVKEAEREVGLIRLEKIISVLHS